MMELSFFNELNSNLKYYTFYFKFRARPNASSGSWLIFLLPLAVIWSTFKLEHVSSQYQSISVFCMDLLISCYAFAITRSKKDRSFLTSRTSVLCFGLLFILIISNEGITFTVIAALLIAIGIFLLLPALLHFFPCCFTVGEAIIVTQSILILLLSTALNIKKIVSLDSSSVLTNLEISTIVLQIGLLGILFLAVAVKTFERLKRPAEFYPALFCIVGFFIFIPLLFILQQDATFWLLSFIFESKRRIILMAYWIFCVVIGGNALLYQINQKRKANTSRRKIFHILAVLAYLPALIYECTLIYLASGIVLALFVLLEMMRRCNIPPLASILHHGFLIFVDEKDAASGVALSPIYLLVGISLPLWIHPYCCDITDSAGFQLLPLISGLITVGIGDTAASVIGVRFGKHHWPGSKKTIEGTVGSIIVQIIFILALFQYGLIANQDILKATVAIVVTSIVEAKTDQIDNLVLPLLGYILLL